MSYRTAFIVITLLTTTSAAAQFTEFWREDFENGCPARCPGDGYMSANGTWSVTDVSTPGLAANIWYVSCRENGNDDGMCGTDCSTADSSLHVGNVSNSPAAFFFCPMGDCGAAYDGTDASCIADKRAESPIIDTTGYNTVRARFVYLGAGQPCQDSADFVYSADGGASWAVLAPCLRSINTSCFPQGMWTELEVDLPVDAGNNPNLRIGFHWRNNGDFIGADPSFAVDDLVLLYDDGGGCIPGALPRDLGNHLLMVRNGGDADLDWSAMGPPAPTTTHFHVYRAIDPSVALPAAWTLLAGDAPTLIGQSWSDPSVADAASYYYNVRSADDCENLSP